MQSFVHESVGQLGGSADRGRAQRISASLAKHLLEGQLQAGWSRVTSAGSPRSIEHELSSSSRLAQFHSHGRARGPRQRIETSKSS